MKDLYYISKTYRVYHVSRWNDQPNSTDSHLYSGTASECVSYLEAHRRTVPSWLVVKVEKPAK